MHTTTASLPTTALTVSPDWIDLYGHMNSARYVRVFDHMGYKLLDQFGVGERYTAANQCGIYTVDIAVSYRREVLVNDPLELRLRILAADDKRLLCLMELHQTRDGYLAATMEQLSIHVDLKTRRVRTFAEAQAAQLQDYVRAHAAHPLPPKHIPRLTLVRPTAV
ncbi:thioesterase family protein [Alcaligenaceae bacterium]|nr:thioesterase family protein [Alcaligenaceae bacterium]